MHPVMLLAFRDEIILKTISIWLIVTRLGHHIDQYVPDTCLRDGRHGPRNNFPSSLNSLFGHAPATDGTPYQNPLQRRTAEPHRDLVGAVLCACVAHFIDVTRVAPTHADEVLIGAGVGHRDDHHAVAVDVDVVRGYRSPREIYRLVRLHP